jgi:hypothetical protein
VYTNHHSTLDVLAVYLKYASCPSLPLFPSLHFSFAIPSISFYPISAQSPLYLNVEKDSYSETGPNNPYAQVREKRSSTQPKQDVLGI